MAKKEKKVEEKVEEVKEPVVAVVAEPVVEKVPRLGMSFGREDLNEMRDVVNELFDKLS